MKRLKCKIIWMAIYTSLVASIALGKIHHEHISTVPSYADFALAFQQLGNDIGRMNVSKLSKDPVKSMGEIFGAETIPDIKMRFGIPEGTDEELSTRVRAISFREFASYVRLALKAKGLKNVTNNEVMRSFFEYTRLNDHARGDWSYMSIGWDFRLYTLIFLMETNEGAKFLFQNFLKRTPLEQRTVVSITANAFHEFFKPENALKMAEIRNEFAKAGSQLEWIGGITRAQLQKIDPDPNNPHGQFNSSIEKIRMLLYEGQISGIDVTGSIVEGSVKYIDLEDKVEASLFERFKIIFDALSDIRALGQLKLHMYESTPEGEFYDIFFAAIKDQLVKKGITGIPPVIRTGHVNALRSKDIARFKEFPELKDRFFFEANLDSNMSLKKATQAKIAGIINELVAEGFNVRLGTDGIGIFGEVAYFESTLQRLIQGGLSKEAEKRLRSNADQLIFNNQNYARFGRSFQCRGFYN